MTNIGNPDRANSRVEPLSNRVAPMSNRVANESAEFGTRLRFCPEEDVLILRSYLEVKSTDKKAGTSQRSKTGSGAASA